MLTVIKKDNTTEEFIDEKIVDAVKKAAFRCDTLIDDEGLARIVSEVRSRLEGRDEVSVLELHELVIAVLSAQQHKQVAEAMPNTATTKRRTPARSSSSVRMPTTCCASATARTLTTTARSSPRRAP